MQHREAIVFGNAVYIAAVVRIRIDKGYPYGAFLARAGNEAANVFLAVKAYFGYGYFSAYGQGRILLRAVHAHGEFRASFHAHVFPVLGIVRIKPEYPGRGRILCKAEGIPFVKSSIRGSFSSQS